MNQTELQEKIALYYSRLPEETKVLFAGMSWIETLKEIDTKYSLNDDQIKTLGTETTLLLLSIISLEDYEKTLREELGLSEEQMDIIIKEIAENIIKDIAPLIYESFNKNVLELMKEKYGEKVDERILLLPEKIQEAIINSGYQALVYETGNRFSLNINQIGILEEITTEVMIGVISPNQYRNEIRTKINITDNITEKITEEINEKVFKNIKENLIDIWDSKTNENVPTPPYSNTLELEIPLPPEKEAILSENKIDNSMLDHGIEILNNNTPKQNQKIIKDISMDIISNKLSSKTINESTISDYSTPNKTNTIEQLIDNKENIPIKPHDPYHEEI